MAGRLVLCPTPIGNLGDITLRALEELRAADIVLAEDTRRTAVLLSHHGISRPMLSYHEHNESRRLGEVLARLRRGERIVLVSDAGTPCVADPGFRLVRAAIESGIEMTALPGPSALLPALTLSGLGVHTFAFYGFLPRAEGARDATLRAALERPLTAIWYESPQRLATSLGRVRDLGFGDRRAAVARELTKIHEEIARGSVSDLADRFAEFPPKGEIVLCIGAAESADSDPAAVQGAIDEVERRCTAGDALSAAVAAVAADRGIFRRALYAAVLERRATE